MRHGPSRDEEAEETSWYDFGGGNLAERPVIEVDTKDRKLDHYFGRHLRLAGFLLAGSGLG